MVLVRTPQEHQVGWKLKASNYDSGYMFLKRLKKINTFFFPYFVI